MDPEDKKYGLVLSTEKDLMEEMKKYYTSLFVSGHDLDIIK
jgi:hypothetical protein